MIHIHKARRMVKEEKEGKKKKIVNMMKQMSSS